MRRARSASRLTTCASASLSRVTSKSRAVERIDRALDQQREIRRHVGGLQSLDHAVHGRRCRQVCRRQVQLQSIRGRRRRPVASDRAVARPSAAPSGRVSPQPFDVPVQPRAQRDARLVAQLRLRALDVRDQVAPRRLADLLFDCRCRPAGLDHLLGQLAKRRANAGRRCCRRDARLGVRSTARPIARAASRTSVKSRRPADWMTSGSPSRAARAKMRDHAAAAIGLLARADTPRRSAAPSSVMPNCSLVHARPQLRHPLGVAVRTVRRRARRPRDTARAGAGTRAGSTPARRPRRPRAPPRARAAPRWRSGWRSRPGRGATRPRHRARPGGRRRGSRSRPRQRARCRSARRRAT